MIALYGQHRQSKKAIQLFNQMWQEGIEPNIVTSVCILDACLSSAALAEGRHMHAWMLREGFDADVILGTCLISMYARCGSLLDAQTTFDKMPERNVISWTTMIAVYTQHGHADGALLLFRKMQENGIHPNEVTFAGILEVCASQAQLDVGKNIHACFLNCGFELRDVLASVLVKMYGECGSLEDARVVFDSMPKGSVVLWTSIIAVHAQRGEWNQALQLFYRMHKECIKPNTVTFICALDACSSGAVLAEGEQLHLDIICNGFEQDVNVRTALVNMYGKCGNLEAAQGIFDRSSDQDVVLWTALISAYAQHGHGRDALWLFEQMQRTSVTPNNVTFMSVLDACSHAGLINEGRHVFAWGILYSDSSLEVDHYICMIDLLGRAGRLDEAEDLISNMRFQPTVILFTAMLGACRYQNDVERAELAAKCMLELDPESSTPYVMMSNLYASDHRREGGFLDGISAAMEEVLNSNPVTA